MDVGVSLGVFMLALAAISFAAKVLTGNDVAWHRGDVWVIVAYAVWGFIYFTCSWAASGRTADMALFGVRVVQDDGTGASRRRAVARTLALPLSFLFLGLGFAGILLSDRRRAARRHRRDGGHLLLGRAGGAAAVPVPGLTRSIPPHPMTASTGPSMRSVTRCPENRRRSGGRPGRSPPRSA